MKVMQLWVRALLVGIAVADILVFSRTTYYTIIFSGIGGVMVLLGLVYAYRPASALGLIVVAAAAANSMDFDTLTTLGTVLTAFLGLMLPLMTLSWLALSAEEEGYVELSIIRRPIAVTFAYAVLTLFSVPLLVLALSFFSPTMSINITTVTEATMMLVTAVLLGLAIMAKSPDEGESL